MPIRDYAKLAEHLENNLFNNPKISEENKEAVNEFLVGWKVKAGGRAGLDVKPARRGIFFNYIIPLLENTDNIKEDMFNEKKITLLFSKLSKQKSDSCYATIVNVSLAFVTKLNDGMRPEGFKKITRVSRKAQERKLIAENMITWEDGLKIIGQTNSVQLRAAPMTQLDGGFRPSEFIDLNYGDISVEKNFIIATVRNGKTGSRDVVLFRAVPYLQRWLSMHPTKKKNDPLWIIENANNSHPKTKKHSKRYSYPALQKRIKELADKAGIKKPMDFYNWRHSACTISKLDNVNPGLAAQKFGHSVEYYEGTYGRLSPKDKINRFKKIYNIEEEKTKKETTRYCEICETVNEPNAEFCEKCGRPLTLDKAMESYNEVKDLKKTMAAMQEKMKKVFKIMEMDQEINKIKSK